MNLIKQIFISVVIIFSLSQTLVAASTLLYLPADYDGTSQAEDVTERADFEPICVNANNAGFVRLPGIDAVRGFSGEDNCPLSNDPVGPLNREVDTIFLIDDTSELSAYLIEAMSQRNGLQTIDGRQVIRPTFVSFDGDGNEDSLSVLVVGEMVSKSLSDESAWLNAVNQALDSPSMQPPGGGNANGLECPAQPSLGGQCWTTEDVIDSHIEPSAQSVLMGMLNGTDTAASQAASSMLCAVKEEKLGGIYLPSRQVPAQRARAAGGNYWTMISPATKNATCYKQPEGENPLMVFRERIQNQQGVLKTALQSSWAECDIPDTTTRCYTETIVRPVSSGGGLTVQVVSSDAGSANFGIVVVATKDSGQSNVTARTDNGTASLGQLENGTYTVSVDGCNLGYGIEVVNGVELTGESKTITVNISPSPECRNRPIPEIPDVVEECESVGKCSMGMSAGICPGNQDCLGPADGNNCGVCPPTSFNLCISQATEIYKRKTKQCDEKEKTDFAKCVPKMIECAFKPGTSCVTDCLIGGPSRTRYSCGGRAAGDYELAKKHCKERAALGTSN